MKRQILILCFLACFQAVQSQNDTIEFYENQFKLDSMILFNSGNKYLTHQNDSNTSNFNDIAYVVIFDSANVIVCKKAHRIETVERILNEKFDQFKKDGLSFELYVEKKRLTKKGKLRRIRK